MASTPALVDEPTALLPVVATAGVGRHVLRPDTPAAHRPQALTSTQEVDLTAFRAALDRYGREAVGG